MLEKNSGLSSVVSLGQYFLGRIFALVTVPDMTSTLSQCPIIKVDALQVYNGRTFMKRGRVIS